MNAGCDCSNHVAGTQRGNGSGVIAELTEDLVGVFTGVGRGTRHGGRRARQTHCLVDQPDIAQLGVMHRGRRTPRATVQNERR